MKKFIIFVPLALGLAACSSNQKVHDDYKRVFLDSTTHEDRPPAWVTNGKLAWEEGGKTHFLSNHTIRGDERVTACFDLANMDARESLLREISDDIKGSVDQAETSISENAEVIAGKVRTAEFQGKISGLRHAEEYMERYRIGDTERIDCHVLSEVSQADYLKTKRSVIDKLVETDPRLKEAITKKQVNFFTRKTASEDEQ